MKEFMLYFSMLMLATSNLYQWIVMARMARKIKGLKNRVERDENHHWALVAQVIKAKKEGENTCGNS